MYTNNSEIPLPFAVWLAADHGYDLVFDPMTGGGTVCVAARELKRQWIGCDIDKEAVEISRRRLAEAD